ncbi:MAG: CoA transferase subunit A [Propionibacterium sp.]|nr:CoA transferase subunit A [Propionibacterium sp.]
MADKRMTSDEAVSQLESGMTIGIGGWASRRKPMALVRALLRSDIKDLTIVAYGGPDVGLLVEAGKVKKVIYGFVSMDTVPLDPHFRAARQRGEIETGEVDEGMLQWGLYAAAINLPFLPTRAGLGSDVMTYNPDLKLVADPYGSGLELVAMPALKLDAALVHVNRADMHGNAAVLDYDPYFDDLYCMAADKAFVSTEKILDSDEFGALDFRTMQISRQHVTGVIEAPNGAHFASCLPDYPRDEAFQKEYATAAADPEKWAEFKQTYLSGTEDDYQAAVARRSQEQK